MKKINASTVFGKEIAGLLKKKPEDEEYYEDTKIAKSRGELRARRKSWGICIARYWHLDCC